MRENSGIQSEIELRRSLDKLFADSKENKPFYGLIEIMKSRDCIITAIHNMKSNKGSKTVGIDDKEINHYLQMNENKLMLIIRNTIDNYFPRSVKRVYIPKSNGKQRPLGIPTILDRIIQEICRIVLEPIAEGKFYEHSYGFRPNRSIENAQSELINTSTIQKLHVVIEGDIKGFFDNINHNKLLEILWNMGVRDKRFLSIIKKMLKAKIFEDGKHTKNDKGTPQGGIISPLLANIYLNEFDWFIAKKYQEHPAKFKVKDPNSHGLRRVGTRHKPCKIIRYADDWVILCKDMEYARKLKYQCEKFLKHRLGLELALEKTHITDMRKQRVKFIGFEFFNIPTPKKRYPYTTKSIPNMEKLNEKVREIIKEIRTLNNLRDNRGNAIIIESINSKIVGIAEFYKTSTSAHIMKRQDQKLYQTQYKKWVKMKSGGQKRRWENYVIPCNECGNRITRHAHRRDRIFYLECDGIKFGITKFAFTKADYPKRLKHGMSIYTEEGRTYFKNKTNWIERVARFGLDDDLETLRARRKELKRKGIPEKYNFEYLMNREYVLIIDKGKCRCCGKPYSAKLHCHHRKPYLPLNEVNKTKNLATVCLDCHHMIHGKELIGTKKQIEKIKKLRTELDKGNE